MSIHIDFNFEDLQPKAQEITQQKAFQYGMLLKEKLRDLVPKHNKQLLSSIQNPVVSKEGYNYIARVEIDKVYADYQDKRILHHRPGYASYNRAESSFAAIGKQSGVSLDDKIGQMENRLSKLTPGTQAYEKQKQAIQNAYHRSEDQYYYNVGLRIAKAEGKTIRKAIKFVEGAFNYLKEKLASDFSK